MRRTMIGVLTVVGALVLGAACEDKGGGAPNTPRGSPTSSPTARSPGGEARPADNDRGTSAAAPSSGAASSMTGTGGAGDAGMGRDAGIYRWPGGGGQPRASGRAAGARPAAGTGGAAGRGGSGTPRGAARAG